MKKSLILSSVFLAGSTFLSSCNSGESGEKKTSNESESYEHEMEKKSQTASDIIKDETSLIKFKDDKVGAIYVQYEALTQSLTEDNITDAKIAAAAIYKGASELGLKTSIGAFANKIAQAKDIEAARKEYALLSEDFTAMVKNSGLTSGTVYLDYCPMALNNKGATWISSTKEIKNPYFGKEMLNCGQIKEVIK